MVKLGDSVRDSMTGFEGVVTGIVEYLHGASQCLVTGKSKDGAAPAEAWFYVVTLTKTLKKED